MFVCFLSSFSDCLFLQRDSFYALLAIIRSLSVTKIIPSFDGNFLLYICSCHLFAAFLPHFSGLRAFIQSKTVL